MVLMPTACGLVLALLIVSAVMGTDSVGLGSDVPVADPGIVYKVNQTERQFSVMHFAQRMSAILLTAFTRDDQNNPAAGS